MKHGGKRPNTGRKPKADEIAVIEQMDAIAVPERLWQNLWALCEQGDIQALKTWASYRFGMPKQQTDVNLTVLDELSDKIANIFPDDE